MSSNRPQISSYKADFFRNVSQLVAKRQTETPYTSMRKFWADCAQAQVVIQALSVKACEDNHEAIFFLEAYDSISNLNNENTVKVLLQSALNAQVTKYLGDCVESVVLAGLIFGAWIDPTSILVNSLKLLAIDHIQESLVEAFKKNQLRDWSSVGNAIFKDGFKRYVEPTFRPIGMFTSFFAKAYENVSTNVSFVKRQLENEPVAFALPGDINPPRVLR